MKASNQPKLFEHLKHSFLPSRKSKCMNGTTNFWKEIKSVAYSSHKNHTSQLDFCNRLADVEEWTQIEN